MSSTWHCFQCNKCIHQIQFDSFPKIPSASYCTLHGPNTHVGFRWKGYRNGMQIRCAKVMQIQSLKVREQMHSSPIVRRSEDPHPNQSTKNSLQPDWEIPAQLKPLNTTETRTEQKLPSIAIVRVSYKYS